MKWFLSYICDNLWLDWHHVTPDSRGVNRCNLTFDCRHIFITIWSRNDVCICITLGQGTLYSSCINWDEILIDANIVKQIQALQIGQSTERRVKDGIQFIILQEDILQQSVRSELVLGESHQQISWQINSIQLQVTRENRTIQSRQSIVWQRKIFEVNQGTKGCFIESCQQIISQINAFNFDIFLKQSGGEDNWFSCSSTPCKFGWFAKRVAGSKFIGCQIDPTQQ